MQQLICQVHNSPFFTYDVDQQMYLCQYCLSQKEGNKYQPIELVQQQQKQIIEEKIKNSEDYLKRLQQIIKGLEDQKQQITDQINKLIKFVENEIAIINNEREQLCQNQEQPQQLSSQIGDDQRQHQQYIITTLDNAIKKFSEFFDSARRTAPKILQKNEEYKLISDSHKSGYACISFNYDNTILIVGCEVNVIVFAFNNGQIGDQLQFIMDHQKDVKCLLFMKQSNDFLSASDDGVIIVWMCTQAKQWEVKQQLTDHNDRINFIEINEKNDLFISGSEDQVIHFWKMKDNKWYSAQKLNLQNSSKKYSRVSNICFDPSETKVIIQIQLSYFVLLSLNEQKNWTITQSIRMDSICSFAYFINQNEFVIIQSKGPKGQEALIFLQDNNDTQFQKRNQSTFSLHKRITDQELYTYHNRSIFQCQLLKQQQLILINDQKSLIIIKIQQNNEFLIQQIIENNNIIISARMNNEGEFLVCSEKEKSWCFKNEI